MEAPPHVGDLNEWIYLVGAEYNWYNYLPQAWQIIHRKSKMSNEIVFHPVCWKQFQFKWPSFQCVSVKSNIMCWV